MKKQLLNKFLQRILLGAILSTTVISWGQTNPAAQTLPYSFTALSSTTLPAGMAAHRFGTTSGTIPTTRTTAVANGDISNNQTNNSGSWKFEGASGISLLASGSQAAGAIVIAINTTGKSAITVKWKAGTIFQQESRDNSLALQYRIGITGTWTDAGTTTTYTSADKTNGDFSGVLTEVLPADANNKAVVQVRWIYWESGTTANGSRDRIAVDDIAITGSTLVAAPTVTTTQLTNADNITATSAILPGGNVTETGGAAITARGIVYSTATLPTLSNSVLTAATATTGTYTTADATSLSPNVRYYYRAYATNSEGTAYGTEYSFYTKALTPGAPIVDPANITVNSVTLAINENSNNTGVTYSIRVNSPGVVNKFLTLSGNNAVIATGTTETFYSAATWGTRTVTGLSADTAYTFDVRGKTTEAGSVLGGGTYTAFSTLTSATTLPSTSPTLTLSSSSLTFGNVCTNTSPTGSFTITGSNISTTGAIVVAALNGYSYALTENGSYTSSITINNFTGSSTTVWVRFSPSAVQSYNGTIHIDGQDDNAVAHLTADATGAGINTAGTVATAAASGITSVSATVAGTVTAGNCTAFTTYGIEYSTTANFVNGTGTQISANNLNGVNFNVALNNLTAATRYYFKAYGTDGAGTRYGTQQSFTTLSLSAPVTGAGLDITQTSFTANWTAVTGATSYRLDVSQYENFGTGSYASDLFFSEYVEGATPGNNRALEIYNGTGAAVNLANYSILRGSGGTALTLSGTLANGETYVIANAQAADNTLAVADRTVTFNESNALSFTGTSSGQTISLLKSGTVIDLIADLLANQTLVRNRNVFGPSTSFVSSQWETFPVDNVDNLGIHTFDGGLTPSFVTGYNNLNVNNTTTQIVTGLSPYTNYYYRVRANSATNTSANSNTTTVLTKPATLTWTGAPAAWVPAVTPDTTVAIVIDADYNTGTNGIFASKSLTLNPGKTLTVTTGTTLTVQDEVTNNAGAANFVIQNNAALIQINEAANLGQVTAIKNSNSLYRLDYTLWSAPVSGQTFTDFSPLTTGGRFYEYGIDNGAEHYIVVPAASAFEAAKGYLVRMPNTNAATGYSTGTTPVTFEGTFTGTPNNGRITRTASIAADRYTGVGNPYPSPISVLDFFNENQNVINGSSGIYLWRKRNNADVTSYGVLNLSGYVANTAGGQDTEQGAYFTGSNSNWTLAQGQGFLVRTQTAPTGTDIAFTNSMRRPASGSQPFFRTAANPMSRFWINITDSENGFGQAMVAYSDATTIGLDYGYDSEQLIDGGRVSLYSIAADKSLSIQARPAFITTDVVAMGLIASNAGQYTIALDRMDGLFEQGQVIYIKDNLLGITRNLTENSYSFTSEAGTFQNRFEIVYTTSALGIDTPTADNNTVMVYKDGSSIKINSGTTDMTAVNIFDIRGRQLYSKDGINVTQTTINGIQVAQEVLIVEITTAKGKVSKKIVF